MLFLTSCAGSGGSGTTPATATVPNVVGTPFTAAAQIIATPATSASPISSTGQIATGASAQTSGSSPSSVTAPVTLTYIIPSGLASQSSGHRGLQYISASNQSLSVVVTPVGGSPPAPVVGLCSTGSCTVSFTANTGPNQLAFRLTDTVGGGGNTLATFTSTVIVQPATLNTFTFSANPIVHDITMSVGSASINAGTASNITLTVNAKDQDGNIITGSGNYLDANGNPLKITLAAVNYQAGGPGTILIKGPLTITNPNQAAITAYYNGGWLDRTVFSATPSGTIGGTVTGATITTTPKVYSYATVGAGPHGICAGPDGNIWFTEYGADKIGKSTLAGVTSDYGGLTKTDPVKIVTGPDGNLWFSMQGGGLGRMTTGGTYTPFTTGLTTGAPVRGLTNGPDGNLWFSEYTSNRIGRLSTSGSISEYSTGITSTSGDGLLTGPDGNLWFAEDTSNKIGRMTPNGVVKEFSTGITAAAYPFGMTNGPDGNIWFTENNGGRIGVMDTAGTVLAEYSTGITTGSEPRNIIVGPDGNLWFNEDSGNRLARITTSGSILEFNSGYAAGRTIDLTVGADGNIWFTEYGANEIGKFVY